MLYIRCCRVDGDQLVDMLSGMCLSMYWCLCVGVHVCTNFKTSEMNHIIIILCAPQSIRYICANMCASRGNMKNQRIDRKNEAKTNEIDKQIGGRTDRRIVQKKYIQQIYGAKHFNECCVVLPNQKIDVTWAMNWIYAANGHAHFIWFLWIRKRWAKPNTNTHSELYTMRTMEYKFHLESMRRCIQWDKEFDILQWINELHWSRCRKGAAPFIQNAFQLYHLWSRSIDRLIDW